MEGVSGVEARIFGINRVESRIEVIIQYDELKQLYHPILQFFGWLPGSIGSLQ